MRCSMVELDFIEYIALGDYCRFFGFAIYPGMDNEMHYMSDKMVCYKVATRICGHVYRLY